MGVDHILSAKLNATHSYENIIKILDNGSKKGFIYHDSFLKLNVLSLQEVGSIILKNDYSKLDEADYEHFEPFITWSQTAFETQPIAEFVKNPCLLLAKDGKIMECSLSGFDRASIREDENRLLMGKVFF